MSTRSNRLDLGIRKVDLAYAKLASSANARDTNRDIVLEVVRTQQPISRADAARISGLQRSTVSVIADELIEDGWIRESGVVRRPRGRRPTLLSMNDDRVVIVCDIRAPQSTIAVMDLNGRFLSHESLPMVSGPSRAIENIILRMNKLKQKHSQRSFEGVGLSLPGRVDPDSQQLIFAPHLKWAMFDIKEAVERGTGLPVEMDNAANTCLLSEMWFGRIDGLRNAVLLTVREGIGTGILANGQLLVGKSGLAGEFGHIPIDPAGPLCACGHKGCWETVASSRAALRYYADLNSSSKQPSIQELMQMAEDNDEHAVEAIKKQAHFLGYGMRAVVAALSPEVIFVNGDIVSSWARFGPIIEEEIARQVLAGKPPQLRTADESETARLRGAGALVLQRHSGRICQVT